MASKISCWAIMLGNVCGARVLVRRHMDNISPLIRPKLFLMDKKTIIVSILQNFTVIGNLGRGANNFRSARPNTSKLAQWIPEDIYIARNRRSPFKSKSRFLEKQVPLHRSRSHTDFPRRQRWAAKHRSFPSPVPIRS